MTIKRYLALILVFASQVAFADVEAEAKKFGVRLYEQVKAAEYPIDIGCGAMPFEDTKPCVTEGVKTNIKMWNALHGPLGLKVEVNLATGKYTVIESRTAEFTTIAGEHCDELAARDGHNSNCSELLTAFSNEFKSTVDVGIRQYQGARSAAELARSLLSTPPAETESNAPRAHYNGDSGYKQFAQCSAWLDEEEGLHQTAERVVDARGELRSEIESRQRIMKKAKAKVDEFSGYTTPSIVESRERYIREHNTAREEAIEMKDRWDDLNDYTSELDRNIERVSKKLGQYCNETFSSEIVKKACDTFNSDTASYCAYFE